MKGQFLFRLIYYCHSSKSTNIWSSKIEKILKTSVWNFFNLTQPQRPPSERVPYISEKLDWIHSTNNYHYWLFCCQWWSDHHDQEVFWENWALEAVEASEVAEATEVNEAGEVFKAWKITTVDFRVFQVLEFNNFRTNFTLFWCLKKIFFDRIMKTHVEF